MRSRIALGIALCAAMLGVPGAVAPAAAHTDVCIGEGIAWVDGTHGFLANGAPPTTTNFGFNPTSGSCLPSLTILTLSGTLSGWCEMATGSGGTGAHTFTMTGSGYRFVLQGEVTGTLTLHNGIAGPCVGQNNGHYYATIAVTLKH